MAGLVVVGSGIAGHEAALSARRAEKSMPVTLVTEETDPLYSPCVLADYVAGHIPVERVFLERRDRYKELGIEVLWGTRAVSLDPNNRKIGLEDGTVLSFDSAVLATGSRPVRIPVPGCDLEGVHVLKTLRDALAIQEARGGRAVVAGSGPVGVEIAMALSSRGWEVHLVEILDRILPRIFDEPISRSIQEMLQAKGISIHLQKRIEALEGEGRVEVVRTSEGAIDAELVVMVAGMRPEVSLAREAGIRLGGTGGIWVDDHMRTSAPGVFACGDCVETRELTTGKSGLFMLWNNAKVQGEVAGSNAAGMRKAYRGSLNITTLNLGETAAASVGRLRADGGTDGSIGIHKKTPNGEIYLVIDGGRIVGVQAIGEIKRVGGLVSSIIKGQRVQEMLGAGAGGVPALPWPLRDTDVDLRSIVSGR